MKVVTAREFNQDISKAKRFAADEPVFVTDRGRPTHVLLSIAAWRQLSGERQNILDLIGAPAGGEPLAVQNGLPGLSGGGGR
jgi:prevent-host-death family protein